MPRLLRRLVLIFLVSTPALAQTPRIVEVGILTTVPPFAYQQDGAYKGMSYDILAAISRAANLRLHLNPMKFDAMIPALQAHQVDVAVAGFFVTDARKRIVDFSDPFFAEGSALAVPVGSPIRSYADLKGKTIAAQQGAAALTWAQKIASANGATVRVIADSANMFLALQAGDVDGVFHDSAVLAYRIAQQSDHKTLRIVGDIVGPTDIAFAVTKGSDLVAILNHGLTALRASGELDRIRKTYVAE